MKLTFTFSDKSDLRALTRDDIFTTSFEIPDEAKNLIGYEERVLAIAQLVGHFTDAALHFSCAELGIKNQPIKSEVINQEKHTLYGDIKAFNLYFERSLGREKSRQLKILLPTYSPLPHSYLISHRRRQGRKSLRKNLIRLGTQWCKTEQDFDYANNLEILADQILVLLNSEATPHPQQHWSCAGFHPWWTDAGLINRMNKLSVRLRKEARQREREEKKRAERALNRPPPAEVTSELVTGAGRRPGAIPGVFKGVQFRSQLEIRFVTEIESRQIRWIYEAERLGDGNYLVDFYLPDYKCWVEVKGKFEPRDEYLLKDVAAYLQRERHERLLVYTQSKCFIVNEKTFKEIPRNSFWDNLMA